MRAPNSESTIASTRTAATSNSAILAYGSSFGVVSRFAAALPGVFEMMPIEVIDASDAVYAGTRADYNP